MKIQGRTEKLKNGGRRDFENVVTTATRPEGPSLRRVRSRGRGVDLNFVEDLNYLQKNKI